MPLTTLEQTLYDVLKEVEWQSTSPIFYYKRCPCCGKKDEEGHSPDCPLDEALRFAEENK